MLGWLKSKFGGTRRDDAGRAVADAVRTIAARYDAAQTTDENKRLWWATDLLSAKAANSFAVRSTLRRRARYEIANNSYAHGIVHSVTNDLVGTGPRLQVKTPDAAVNKQVEDAFNSWAEAINLTQKLRTLKLAKTGDGEGFWILRTNPGLDHSVKLYPQEIEADQVTTPNPRFAADYWVDGLELDEFGEPKVYHVLKVHPGDSYMPLLNPLVFESVAARYMIHWFRKDRPGQVRGVPELTPALDLFGEIRAYRKSVLASARLAAVMSAVVESPAPADTGAAEPAPFDKIPLDNGMFVTLPWGTKLNQLHPEQPTTNFDSFVEKLLAEACRCLNVPLNVALGTSQKFNFSSARLDHVNYRAGLGVERDDCECVALGRLLAAWLDEAIMVPDLLPAGLDIAELPHEWHWPAWEPLDNLVDAQADTERLKAKTLSFTRYYARQGLDVEEELQTLADERKLAAKLGLTLDEVAPAVAAPAGKPGAPAQPAPATEGAAA